MGLLVSTLTFEQLFSGTFFVSIFEQVSLGTLISRFRPFSFGTFVPFVERFCGGRRWMIVSVEALIFWVGELVRGETFECLEIRSL